MKTQFTPKHAKQKIFAQLNQQFGISLPENSQLIQSAKEKLRLLTSPITQSQLTQIEEIAPIEALGLYLAKEERDLSLRLSLDATHIFPPTKNITQLSDEEAEQYLQGHDLQKTAPKTIQAIQHNDDFLGCAKSTGTTLLNHIPKPRRIRP